MAKYLREISHKRSGGIHGVELTSYGEHDSSGWTSGYPMGTVAMVAGKELPNFSTSLSGEQQSSAEYHAHSREASRNPPRELFTHVSPQVISAFSDPRMRHTIPTMIAIGMKALGAEHDVPMADYSLSAHSSKLSKNAANRGLAVPDPGNPRMRTGDEGSGRVSDMRRRFAVNLPNPKAQGVVGTEWVPEHEVAAGREWVRNRLRGPRNLGPQFTPQPEGEQGTLF